MNDRPRLDEHHGRRCQAAASSGYVTGSPKARSARGRGRSCDCRQDEIIAANAKDMSWSEWGLSVLCWIA